MTGKFLLLLLAVEALSFLYTPSALERMGINLKEAVLQTTPHVQADTKCRQVDLRKGEEKYDGFVMTGYLSVGKGNSVLGFIFYGKKDVPLQEVKNYPIILWLNGGPGSSSQIGNFMELGPFLVQPGNASEISLKENPHSWILDYNVLFVDQPVGTGLSYADETVKNVFCSDMECVGNDFYNALDELYHKKGCFDLINIEPSHPLVIFGESYAGKYAPAIGLKIFSEAQDKGGFLTGLKGVAIGDGFTQPIRTLEQVGEYAYNLGLIDYQERMYVERLILNATYQEHRGLLVDMRSTFDLVMSVITEVCGGVNVYDITKYENYNNDLIIDFLRDPDTIHRYALNDTISFNSQMPKVYEAFAEDFMKPYVHMVEELLDRGLNVLVYNGQNDLIVETPGTFKWVEEVRFNHSEEFREKLLDVWKVGNRTAGYKKEAGFLQIRTVNNAGHLVPMDQGEAARTLMNEFLTKVISK